MHKACYEHSLVLKFKLCLIKFINVCFKLLVNVMILLFLLLLVLSCPQWFEHWRGVMRVLRSTSGKILQLADRVRQKPGTEATGEVQRQQILHNVGI